jgi:uncharacterized protein YecE (DUF72 family)
MHEPQAGAVYVGPAGWAYDDWKGIVYPPRMPKSVHPLELLSAWFDLMELNVTFYRPPDARQCATWVRKVAGNPHFRFTAKLWEGFTHQREAWPGEDAVRRFRDGIAPLLESGRLGALLAQFPWSFKRTPDNRRWLARVLDAFEGLPMAVEIRHDSWNRPEVFAGLAERGVAFCNIDQPIFRDSLRPTDAVTARIGYVRLHGRNADDWFRPDAGRDDRYNYLYSEEDLQPWLEKIRHMRNRVNELFIVTNNHYRGQAVVNALEIQAALGKGAPRTLPPHLIDHYPRLRKVFTEGS